MQVVPANKIVELLERVANGGRLVVALPDPLADQFRRVMSLCSLFNLTRGEARVLLRLAQDERVTKEELHAALAPNNPSATSKNLEVIIHRLRRKLTGHGIRIATIWGCGYQLVGDGRDRFQSLLDEQAEPSG